MLRYSTIVNSMLTDPQVPSVRLDTFYASMGRKPKRRKAMGEWIVENYGFRVDCEEVPAVKEDKDPTYNLKIVFPDGKEKEVFLSLLQALQPKFNEAIKKTGKNPTAFAPPSRSPRVVPPERQAEHAAAVDAENRANAAQQRQHTVPSRPRPTQAHAGQGASQTAQRYLPQKPASTLMDRRSTMANRYAAQPPSPPNIVPQSNEPAEEPAK
jgi:hypothetical protein